jgi:hypothetical protein
MVKLIEDRLTHLAQGEAAVALREGWKTYFGQYPSQHSLALLWAQSALETGRWKFIHCYNFGNIKKKHDNPRYKQEDDGHDWCMFRCNEIINGKVYWFDPPHPQTHFRAYTDAHDGALDYIRLLVSKTRYAGAWHQVITGGSPQEYSHQLKLGGYYTASESLYTKGVVRLTNEFNRRYDELIHWTTSSVKAEKHESIIHLLSDEEKAEVIAVMGSNTQLALDEYFNLTDRYIDDIE